MFFDLAVKPLRALPYRDWLRLITPRSLVTRSLLIVILPILILQAVLAYVFYERHWDTVTRWLALGLAGEVSMVVKMLETAPDSARKAETLDLARAHLGLAISFEPGGKLSHALGSDDGLWDGQLNKTLTNKFGRRLDYPFAIDTRPTGSPKRIAVYVELEDGLLRVLAPRKRVDSTTTKVFISWMVGLSVLLLLVAIYFLTRQLRPIRRLVRAADSFGKGRDVGDFRLQGASEIRKAGTAFNSMRRRILRHISQRTEMLAAVSHDLRTPLTRMKLELEMLTDAHGQPGDLQDLRADVEEMAEIVDGYLTFARGDGQEAMVVTDLGGLLTEAANRVRDNSVKVDIELETAINLPLRPIAFRRCLTNLVENAARHAHWIGIRAATQGDQVWLAVDDDGPGIPEAERQAVFKAFYRLDPSRNPSTGGVGLGLTIARDIVLGHGGDIELSDAPTGGLRVLIRLPK